MPWFKKINSRLLRLVSGGNVDNAFMLGVDAGGKKVVFGTTAALIQDSLFTNGSASSYGKGSLALDKSGGMHVVDADGLWQGFSITTASQSTSPSSSVSPSSSASVSVSPSVSLSQSPSASASLSVSPSASASPSA